MYILGISCFYHDAAAVILKDGVLLAAAEEERFSRIKHDFNFPKLAIEFCLKKAGITAQDLDYVVFYEKPFKKFERIIFTIFGTVPFSVKTFREAMIIWLSEKLWIKSIIRDNLNIAEEKIYFPEHHISHAAAAFLCSPFEEAAILTIDGVGEWTTTALGKGRGNQIELIQELKFPHSVGLLYSAFTAFLGFEVNEGEYKVMGMAPYGQPRFADKIMQILQIKDDGSIKLDMSYFAFHNSTEHTFSHKFTKIFGKARPPKEKEILDPYYADIAASIQYVTEEIILKMAKHLHHLTGLNRLCLAGGVALNSVANGRIFRETPFKELFIQPAAGDSGGALGAALYFYYSILNNPRNFVLEHAYWGEEYSNENIKAFLTQNNIPHQEFDEDGIIVKTVAELMQGKVVGWFQGRFEWGPRALGNRSILADPRKIEMKDIVNRKIKFREPFRPFAPVVTEAAAEEYFEIENVSRHYPTRFMLLVTPVREEKKSVIPAVTHVDGSARLQVIKPELNYLYHKVVEEFGKATGVPVLLNTSFNLRGEPIVTTPANAYSTFSRSEMDALVMGNYWIEK
jgi:carbamoyltransferase